MFNFNKKKEPIDLEIERVLEQLAKMDADSPKYKMAVDNLKVLHEARSCKDNAAISMDVIVMAVTNIVGILLVLDYERLHVFTSKAIGFVVKGRL
jgi:hypothetical protein